MNPFGTKEFLEFGKPKDLEIVDQGIFTTYEDDFLPYYIVKIKENNYIITPICLSGPSHFSIVKNLQKIKKVFHKYELFGGYIQTREIINYQPKFFDSGDFVYYLNYRTNYRVLIQQSLELQKDNFNRTTKRYCNYILKNYSLDDFQFERIDYKNNIGLSFFHKYYNITANEKYFKEKYRFELKNWKNLLLSEYFNLYNVYYNGEFVSGTMITNLIDGFDYTFVTHNKKFKHSARINIIILFNYLKNIIKDTYIDLGGGVSEGDSLTSFKKGVGGKPINFKNVKFCFKINDKKDYSFMEGNWPL